MKISNTSVIPTATLRSMAEFILKMSPQSSVAQFAVWDMHSPQPGQGTGGKATWDPATNGTLYPVLVEVAIAYSLFPKLDQYVPDFPAILLRSHEEELFLVLAHEMRHAAQYVNGFNLEDPRAMEVDAEGFAISALHEWRRLSPINRCRTTTRRKAA